MNRQQQYPGQQGESCNDSPKRLLSNLAPYVLAIGVVGLLAYLAKLAPTIT